jgi:hypothetical protein
MFWLSAKDWPTVHRTFVESFLLSALGEGFGWRLRSHSRDGCLRPLNSPRAWRFGSRRRKYTRRRCLFHREHYTFGECFVSAHGEFSKKFHIFESKLFPWSTYTHTIYMFKIGTILSLFAIFNNFTSFFVFVSYTSDMNCNCIKS